MKRHWKIAFQLKAVKAFYREAPDFRMSSNHKKLAYLAFALYFLSGVVCMLIGSTMSSLVELYSQPLEKIVLFIGAFATGRTLSVYMIGTACG